jgi:plasmid maintenance system antidote protein VapI
MIQNEFKAFLNKSGLKQKFIAEMLYINPNVLTKWITEQCTLTVKQMDRLDIFVSEFYKNNTYMQK